MEIVFIFDDTGTILYANRSAKEALMYYDDLCGCPIAEIFPGEFTLQDGIMNYNTLIAGLDFFQRLRNLDQKRFSDKKTIIFYGGEPFHNKKLLFSAI